mmetsp:Transcript_4599/g.10103  ORF Transcript_4599/g.10103 Transcript_4599/m.10103 type:complete len:240 (-) Transcript_4599:33-752(-)
MFERDGVERERRRLRRGGMMINKVVIWTIIQRSNNKIRISLPAIIHHWTSSHRIPYEYKRLWTIYRKICKIIFEFGAMGNKYSESMKLYRITCAEKFWTIFFSILAIIVECIHRVQKQLFLMSSLEPFPKYWKENRCCRTCCRCNNWMSSMAMEPCRCTSASFVCAKGRMSRLKRHWMMLQQLLAMDWYCRGRKGLLPMVAMVVWIRHRTICLNAIRSRISWMKSISFKRILVHEWRRD